MKNRSRTIVRYSISFKQKVVSEIECEGLSIPAAARRYGIGGGSTIQRWLQDFGKNQYLNKIIRVETRGEKDRLKELEEENRRLKIALAEKTMQNDVLETIIDLVDEHYQTDVKKNLGPQVSKKSGGKNAGR